MVKWCKINVTYFCFSQCHWGVWECLLIPVDGDHSTQSENGIWLPVRMGSCPLRQAMVTLKLFGRWCPSQSVTGNFPVLLLPLEVLSGMLSTEWAFKRTREWISHFFMYERIMAKEVLFPCAVKRIDYRAAQRPRFWTTIWNFLKSELKPELLV